MGGSGSSHRELCRDVGLGRDGDVGACVGQRLLVNNGRGESVLDGVGLKTSVSPALGSSSGSTYLVDNIRLNPNAGEGGRDNLGIGLGDNVGVNLLDRVGLGQNLRLNHMVGGGDGDGQSLGHGDVESLGLDIDLGLGVEDRGGDVLKSSKI